MKPDLNAESISEVNGELVMNAAAMLRWLYEMDLGDVNDPESRATLERYQRLARTVIAAEPATSTRTVGQILSTAWGAPPLAASGFIDADSLLVWLGRKVVGLPGGV